MGKAAEVLEIPATITARGQTTVPAAVRKMLGLGKRGRVVFRGLADGTVVIAKADEARSDDDPVLRQFLAFLERDMTARPQVIRAVPRSLVERARALVDGVEVDLDAALPDDDDERALEYARGKANALRSHDLDTAMRRLIGQLARRGYSGSVASNAARTALTEQRSGGGVQFR